MLQSYDLLEVEPIERRAILGKQSSMSRTYAFYVDGVIRVFRGLVSGRQDGCGAAIAIAAAIEET